MTGETIAPLTEADVAQFQEQGYVVVRDVLPPERVAELRRFCEQLFDAKPVHAGDIQVKNDATGRGGGVRQDIASRYPELRFILGEPRILGALRSILGDDLVFLPEMAAHDSRYGHWHKDTTPMERDGLTFHYEPDFRMVQCAIYLQDNDEHGGGLDVVPGSQHERDHTPPAPRVTFLDRVANKLNIRLKKSDTKPLEEPGAISIPSHAGDLVIFNVLVNHQATQPANGDTMSVPGNKRKFAFFFLVGADNPHTYSYRDYIARQYPHLEGHSYPDEILSLAEAGGIKLA